MEYDIYDNSGRKIGRAREFKPSFWAMVFFLVLFGFIALTIQDCENKAKAEFEASTFYVKTTSNVIVRDNPSLNGHILGTIRAGQKILIIDTLDPMLSEYYTIKGKKAKFYRIQSDYLTLHPPVRYQFVWAGNLKYSEEDQ
ncbi:MAG: hypothetical protein MUD08_12680 [Cytophagales bacterium]|jgi:uncharacterized protein YgiM (DUF1202 family)|nr:hypothetical protein [Cytophagales bacterium]